MKTNNEVFNELAKISKQEAALANGTFSLAEMLADLQRDMNRLLVAAKLPVNHTVDDFMFPPSFESDVAQKVIPIS